MTRHDQHNDVTERCAPTILRGDAAHLPLPDESVDLIVTSPPYFGLRSYQDGGQHYDGQIGAEATPAEFIAALITCTREWMRVLKPSGSIFVNLGDKYGRGSRSTSDNSTDKRRSGDLRVTPTGYPKSLLLLPERYRIAAVDELGLIARAVIVWSKPNGLPESVTDRVRRSHEDWVHLTKQPRYFAAIDEIREASTPQRGAAGTFKRERPSHDLVPGQTATQHRTNRADVPAYNPLGKLPGSVWEIATQPLKVPAELGVDHFAAFPMEWPRRLILGWSPREVCTVCGEGRRPVVQTGDLVPSRAGDHALGGEGVKYAARDDGGSYIRMSSGNGFAKRERTITGYSCACPDTTAPSTPGVVLDPFGGTGTTALVATMLGRTGISVDLSADYCRLAQWRCADPKQRERATQAKVRPLREVIEPEPIDLSDMPMDPLLAAIADAPDRAALTLLWRTNRDTWTAEYQLAVEVALTVIECAA